ncbi:unnamed protein product [Ranitomeya imitator]|uniref:Sclerostin domain-containing protein 1 n=1 Tax=Ranitomeya imitator TaxID=111125 RepID=A0ABN9MCV2_9NEOB|nr:unnamed protein product [Ranitomeya imitator]
MTSYFIAWCIGTSDVIAWCSGTSDVITWTSDVIIWCSETSQHQVGCRELRSTKYISDGQCTSLRPLKELVCAGECLPLPILPNWIGGGYGLKYWSRRSTQEWRCVNDKMRTQRIQLQCADGTTRTYKVTVVTSCKCKRYTRQHNESSHNYEGVSPLKPAHAHQHHHSHSNRDKKRLSKISKFIAS